MKFLLLGCFTWALSFAALAGSLNCSSSDGRLKYKTSSYSGGAAPAPGMLLHQRQWLFDGSVVFQERNYMGCDFDGNCREDMPQEIDSNIDWKELQETKLILEQDGAPGHFISTTIYAIKISLFSKIPGQVMTGLNQEKIENWFLCEQIDTFYP